MTELGNAWEGVTPEGKKLPQVVQEAVAEVEKFDFGEEGQQVLRLFWKTISDSDVGLQREKAKIEIERQQHFDDVLLRKMKENRCPVVAPPSTQPSSQPTTQPVQPSAVPVPSTAVAALPVDSVTAANQGEASEKRLIDGIEWQTFANGKPPSSKD